MRPKSDHGSLAGRRALVTGAASGIGRATAIRLAAARTLAVGVEPVYVRGARTVRVPIAKTGLRVLRHGGRVSVRVTATFRAYWP